jgi:hypothetical protein
LIDPSTNEIFYVGKGNRRRMYDHEKDVIKGKYPNNNRHLYYKIKKILKSEKKIIYFKPVDNVDEITALIKESEEIKKIGRADLNLGTLCNHTDGGEGSTGYHHSETHKQSLRQYNPGGIKTSFPILQFDLLGNFLKEWNSCSQASKQLFGIGKIFVRQISVAARNHQSYNNFIWIFKTDTMIKNNTIDLSKIKIRDGVKTLKQLDNTGYVIKTWNSISEACNTLKITPSMISWASKNNKSHKGFYWKIYE